MMCMMPLHMHVNQKRIMMIMRAVKVRRHNILRFRKTLAAIVYGGVITIFCNSWFLSASAVP